jgi:hypothetical protein
VTGRLWLSSSSPLRNFARLGSSWSTFWYFGRRRQHYFGMCDPVAVLLARVLTQGDGSSVNRSGYLTCDHRVNVDDVHCIRNFSLQLLSLQSFTRLGGGSSSAASPAVFGGCVALSARWTVQLGSDLSFASSKYFVGGAIFLTGRSVGGSSLSVASFFRLGSGLSVAGVSSLSELNDGDNSTFGPLTASGFVQLSSYMTVGHYTTFCSSVSLLAGGDRKSFVEWGVLRMISSVRHDLIVPTSGILMGNEFPIFSLEWDKLIFGRVLVGRFVTFWVRWLLVWICIVLALRSRTVLASRRTMTDYGYV